jgi:hypothetical protein
MRHLNKFLFLGILTAFLGKAPFAAESKVEAPSKSITINFDKGSDALTADSQKALEQFVAQTSPSEVTRFVIAAWSDRPFNQNQDLPGKEKNLASKRLDHINDYLKDNLNTTAKVDKYNMAEKSNWLNQALGTKDAELKKTMTGNHHVEFSKQEFLVLKNHGGPQKAVVVAKTEVLKPQDHQQ